MADIHKFPTHDGRVELGPSPVGQRVMVDGRCVPKLLARDHGNKIEFILDDRLSYTFPAEISLLVASAIGNAMAIGAGWPCVDTDERAPFAPRVFMTEPTK